MSAKKFIFVDFFAVKINGSDVDPGIYVIVKTRSYRHTLNGMGTILRNNIQKFSKQCMARLYIKTHWSYETDSSGDVTSVNFKR